MIEEVTKPRVRVAAGRSDFSLETKVEGKPTSGPWFLPISGGWLPAEVGDTWNWWQRGFNLETMVPSALVEACISAYAQTMAMCPGDHWKLDASTNGRRRITTSALSRILKYPNQYQTISDFMLNAVRYLYSNGNTYALALRNSRFEISELHLMNSMACSAYVSSTGEIFYQLSGNQIIDRMIDEPLLVPARDVLHIRLHTRNWNQLLGESPIVAAARDIASGDAMATQQLAFYLNQARPSTVLSTDMILDKDQVQALRDRWNEQSRGLASGGTPILTAGLKPVQLSMNAVDSQLAEVMKLNEQHIALAFRIPLQILGIGTASAGTTEELMNHWLASSLGFCLNHVEEAFGKLFGLGGYPDEYIEFDTKALLRSAYKDRMDGLTKAVIGGVLSPDEARATEGYAKVPGGFGEEPRVQQQVVPLSAASAIPATPAPPSSPPAAPAAAASKQGISDEERLIFGARVAVSRQQRQQTKLLTGPRC
jgi:HK97 family phage portal protein